MRDADYIREHGQQVQVGDRRYRWRHTGNLQYIPPSKGNPGKLVPVTDSELGEQAESVFLGPFVTKGTLVREEPKVRGKAARKQMKRAKRLTRTCI